jgi:zinc protease
VTRFQQISRFACAAALISCAHAKTPPKAPSPKPVTTKVVAAEPPDPEPFRAVRPAPGAPGQFEYPTPEQLKLANGMSVYLVKRPARIAALKLVISHGATAAPEGKSGLASLTARMLTESTKKKSSAALAEAVEALGTTIGSDASRDESDVSMTVLPADLPRALGLLAEVVVTPAFSATDFARVRAEWLDGMRGERQNPTRLATLAAIRAVYGPLLGAPVSGSIPEVERLTAADLRDFHRQHYTPDNAALVVVGDVDARTLMAEVGKAFGAWRGKSSVVRAPVTLPGAPEKTRVLLIDRPGAVQSAVVTLQPFPKRTDPGYEARQAMGRVLGGLFTSRLNTNLREEHAYTYGAFSQPISTRQWGALLVSTSVRTDATAAALDEIVLELKRMHDPSLGAPVRPDELARAKADLIFHLGATLEHPNHVAEEASELFVDGLPLDYNARYPSLVSALNEEQVGAEARGILPTRQLVVIVGDRGKVEAELTRRGYTPEIAPSALTD